MTQMNRMRAAGLGAVVLVTVTSGSLACSRAETSASAEAGQKTEIVQATVTRPPGAYSAPVPNPPLYPDPPQKPMHWSIDTLRRIADARAAFARANGGRGSIGFATGANWAPGGNAPGGSYETWPGQSFRTHGISELHLRVKYDTPKYSRMIGALSDIDDADQHFNGADFLVIVGGEGDVTVGGEIAVRNYMHYPMDKGTVRLMPGEFHGQPIKNGTTFHVKAGDWVYVPPYAPHLYSAAGNAGLVYTLIKLGVEPLGVVPNDLVVLEGTAVQQDAEQRLVWRDRRPEKAIAAGSRPRFPHTPDRGFHWTLAEITKAHETLAGAEQARTSVDPNTALHDMPFWTRKHSMFVMHVPQNEQGKTAAQHVGYAQVVLVMGGSGTVDAGGQLQAATPLVEGGKQIWGEMRGTAVTGGERFTLKAGDWVSIPPQTPAQFKADAAGGLTYLVMKVPADIFPWDLIR